MSRSPDGWVVLAYSPEGSLLASTSSSDVTIDPASDETALDMDFRDGTPKFDLYRGKMRMVGGSEGVTAVNIVGMDDYLKGVVPAEMPPLWAIEAVKAQAVAARGYAYNQLKASNVYDVRPTAANQVYGGVGSSTAVRTWRSMRLPDRWSWQEIGSRIRSSSRSAAATRRTMRYAWVNDRGKVVASPISYLRGSARRRRERPRLRRGRGRVRISERPVHLDAARRTSWPPTRERMSVALLDLRFDRGVSGRVYRVTVVGSDRTASVSGSGLQVGVQQQPLVRRGPSRAR